MLASRRAFLIATCAAVSAAGVAAARPAAAESPFAAWSDENPPYRLCPGDEIELTVPSAPELSRSLRLGPDGRLEAPLVGAVMAQGLTPEALARRLGQAYAGVLLRPKVEVALRRASPAKVFVGGEVRSPGVYALTGGMDALQAILAAGGFRPTARPGRVVILRRGGDGRPMMRVVDLSRALSAPPAERTPLRAFDIVFAPRFAPAEAAAYLGEIIRALPLSFSWVTVATK